MDLFARIADHLRLLELETPRVTSTGKQIIQEDKPPQHNERDLFIQGIASGQGQQDLAVKQANSVHGSNHYQKHKPITSF